MRINHYNLIVLSDRSEIISFSFWEMLRRIVFLIAFSVGIAVAFVYAFKDTQPKADRIKVIEQEKQDILNEILKQKEIKLTCGIKID